MAHYRIIVILYLLFVSQSLPAQENNEKQVAFSQAIKKKTNGIIYGTASYYADKFQNRKTANGEIFDQQKMTAACNVLPLGTWIKVTNLKNKRSVVVKINDRLHGKMKRAVDLTKEAARQLGFIRSGLTKVKVEVIGKKKPNP